MSPSDFNIRSITQTQVISHVGSLSNCRSKEQESKKAAMNTRFQRKSSATRVFHLEAGDPFVAKQVLA
jgi:siroheme synthase